jgi:large subunit ribosomal protein L4
MKLEIKNLRNESVGETDVSDEVFGYPYKEHLIHLAVVSIRAAQRAGTHNTKRRGEVSGSGKKLWRQKGTGRARVGSRRSPIWKGGGTVHGPRPRSHANRLSPREKRNALKSALSRKLEEKCIVVVDSLELESLKTRDLALSLGTLGIDGKALLVDDWGNEKLALAARNNPKLKTVDALGVNVYDVVDRHYLVLSRQALDRLSEVLSQ